MTKLNKLVKKDCKKLIMSKGKGHKDECRAAQGCFCNNQNK